MWYEHNEDNPSKSENNEELTLLQFPGSNIQNYIQAPPFVNRWSNQHFFPQESW